MIVTLDQQIRYPNSLKAYLRRKRAGASGLRADLAPMCLPKPPTICCSEPRHDLVVCMAPMYIYTDWETLLVGIETWLALGATKIIVPVQSASSSCYKILQEYERRGRPDSRHHSIRFQKVRRHIFSLSETAEMSKKKVEQSRSEPDLRF